jgi:hypothetical protein
MLRHGHHTRDSAARRSPYPIRRSTLPGAPRSRTQDNPRGPSRRDQVRSHLQHHRRGQPVTPSADTAAARRSPLHRPAGLVGGVSNCIDHGTVLSGRGRFGGHRVGVSDHEPSMNNGAGGAGPEVGDERVCSPVGVSALLLRRRGTRRCAGARVGRVVPSPIGWSGGLKRPSVCSTPPLL